MRGSGKAEIFAMIAHPVDHAKSPGIFNELFERRGLDSLMVPLTCRPEAFATLWDGLTAATNVRGAIISVPFKTVAFELCASAHERARRVRSTNCIRRAEGGGWHADNFDGVGFIDALAAGGHALAGRAILQLGAGGAGTALAYGLAEAGARHIRLFDVDAARAGRLAELVMAAFPACRVETGSADPTGMDMVINATPVGMHAGDPLPVDAGLLRPEMTVVDIIMEPAETALLREARRIGCRVQEGRPMMDFQVGAMCRFFGIGEEGETK